MRLAAGLRPDPLGELESSPDPLAAIGGRVLLLRGRKGRGAEGEKEGEGKEREMETEGGKGYGGEGRGGHGIASSLFNYWLRAWQ